MAKHGLTEAMKAMLCNSAGAGGSDGGAGVPSRLALSGG